MKKYLFIIVPLIFFSFGLLVVPAHAAISFKQGTSTDLNASSSNKIKFASAPALNDLIVGAATWGNTGYSNSTMTCSDSAGDSFATTTAADDPPDQQTVEICYAIVTHSVSSDTVTFSFPYSANGSQSAAIEEYSGIATSSPLDVSQIHYSTGCSGTNCVTSNASTTTKDGDLIVGYVINSDGAGGTITKGTNFTKELTPTAHRASR